MRFVFRHTYNDNKEAFHRGKVKQVPDQVIFHMSQSFGEKETSSAYSGETSYKKEVQCTSKHQVIHNNVCASFVNTVIYG